MRYSNYDKMPSIPVDGTVITGWKDIFSILGDQVRKSVGETTVIVIETYIAVNLNELKEAIGLLDPSLLIDSRSAFLDEKSILQLTGPYVTDDEIFGYMSPLLMENFLDKEAVTAFRRKIGDVEKGIVVIAGPGASLVTGTYDLLVYADMPRWEIQKRMKRGESSALGVDDSKMPFSHKYKRGYFVDWRVCDRLKSDLFPVMDYILDTTQRGMPKMISAGLMFSALKKTSGRPFRVVPYFDPGPWGGQWMKEVCELDRDVQNFAWCFDCVPEENSLLLDISGTLFEIPAINLVFCESMNLLGKAVVERFGREFPIRFDFLDTMEGGNLSLQVHPGTEYIRKTFGMEYTQDESYYLLDAAPDATVWLGLRTGTDAGQMLKMLKDAHETGGSFDPSAFVNILPARKHDHFLIPAGTVHCSGRNCMVLEISATPYIFTFKMWDWDRPGLDGKPRPINIRHAANSIRWERDTRFVSAELVNKISHVSSGEGWREERTGLHQYEFIETCRHWFTKKVVHSTYGTVNVLNLVEGSEAIIESPQNLFDPFVVHYAETFIVPASVQEYTIRPYGTSEGHEIATIKAFVRI